TLTTAKRLAQEQAWADLFADFDIGVNTLFTAVLGHAATDAPALTAQGALPLPAAPALPARAAPALPPAGAAPKPIGAAAGVIIGELAATIDARTPRSVTFD